MEAPCWLSLIRAFAESAPESVCFPLQCVLVWEEKPPPRSPRETLGGHTTGSGGKEGIRTQEAGLGPASHSSEVSWPWGPSHVDSSFHLTLEHAGSLWGDALNCEDSEPDRWVEQWLPAQGSLTLASPLWRPTRCTVEKETVTRSPPKHPFRDQPECPQTPAHLITSWPRVISCNISPSIPPSKTHQVLLIEPGMHGLGPSQSRAREQVELESEQIQLRRRLPPWHCSDRRRDRATSYAHAACWALQPHPLACTVTQTRPFSDGPWRFIWKRNSQGKPWMLSPEGSRQGLQCKKVRIRLNSSHLLLPNSLH